MFEMDYHVLQLVSDGATQQWVCPECGRHLQVAWRPDFSVTVLAAGDEQVSHVSAHESIILSGPATMDGDLVAETPGGALGAHASGGAPAWSGPYVDRFITFDDPEVTDGLTPWIRLIKRLDQGGTR